MERINLILNNEKYKSCLEKLEELEKDRKFCRHTPEHFLDTARIMYITALEENLPVSKEIVYATALLHDIGRVKQYEENIPHDRAGADFAREILPSARFTNEETEEIASAIFCHRNRVGKSVLGKLLCFADKKSRLCFLCKAREECNWEEGRKNKYIRL